MSSLIWTPDENRINSSNMNSFTNFINKTYNLGIEDYRELYQFSIERIEDFWKGVWLFTDIIHSNLFDKVIDDISVFPGTKWFPGAQLNFAENLLRYRDNQKALIFRGEAKKEYSLTYQELYHEVAKIANGLRALNLTVGDRVVGYMPNIIETVVAMLATASIGCVWASCGAELGPDAVIDRLGQLEPKILFTVDGYIYKGKDLNILTNVDKITKSIPSIKKVIIQPFLNEKPVIELVPNAILYKEFQANQKQEAIFEQLPFDHPLYIMFSSGTTGKPKSMVQGAGGILLNHLKELILHSDLKRTDVICYVTSPSWMMWNWLVSSLAVGATIVLFNGNPSYPDWKYIWNIIVNEKISIFGTSASYINFLMKENLSPKKEFNLNHLREISQTASALSEEGFKYVYSDIKEDLHFNSISGGTDINGCFAAGSPTLPVYTGEIQAPALGMKIQSYDELGKPVLDEQGELVCESPSPSMPIYFWGDERYERYRKSYFEFYQSINKNVWRHGDYIIIHSKTGGVTFLGRSDAVLKPSGVRIGTSEIYNILEQLPEIEDSVVIGQQWEGDQRIILFVKLREGYKLNDKLCNKIKNELKVKASPRHVPSIIVKTEGIPYTFSNKKVEIAITNIAHGRPVVNTGALANPESLDFYRKYFSR